MDEKRRQRDEQLAYEKANREREYRMKQREEQKAMIMDLPAGEVEDWQTQQEHVAATTVQASWKRHKAEKHFWAEREARAKAAAKIQRQYRKHNRRKPPQTRQFNDAAEDANVLMGSMDLGNGGGFGSAPEEVFSVPRPAARHQKAIDQILNSRKMDARREMEAAGASSPVTDGGGGQGGRGARGAVTMEAWSEGRQRTQKLLEEYGETAAKAAAAAAARRKACRQAEGVYRAQRAMRHGSLAELPADAKPNQFPSPVGVNEKVTRRLHAEALEAAQVESKWWKPLLALNREQKVLDQQEVERRRSKQQQEEGANKKNAKYKSNRDRAGVHLTPTKSDAGRGLTGESGAGGFGIDAELY